jgi:hypothetical protein
VFSCLLTAYHNIATDPKNPTRSHLKYDRITQWRIFKCDSPMSLSVKMGFYSNHNVFLQAGLFGGSSGAVYVIFLITSMCDLVKRFVCIVNASIYRNQFKTFKVKESLVILILMLSLKKLLIVVSILLFLLKEY